jgi:hypothetical protein
MSEHGGDAVERDQPGHAILLWDYNRQRLTFSASMPWLLLSSPRWRCRTWIHSRSRIYAAQDRRDAIVTQYREAERRLDAEGFESSEELRALVDELLGRYSRALLGEHRCDAQSAEAEC